MDYTKKTRKISNSLYNLGLERAKIRDLTGSVECLKKCLHFNKYHMDARNLLGLIYYEVGEVADALVQWVISMNLQPENNRADYFLGEIQRKPGRLEIESQTIKKYNQALIYAQSESDDLAILQLNRAVEANPNYVKAHLLLAVLFMAHEDFVKAGKSLFKILQVDKNHPRALWYMSIVKENTGKADVERRKLANAFSHRQMQDDDIIIPPSYKENTGWQTILNIMAGLLLGAAVIFFLVMPANTKGINSRHNQEMLSYSEQLNEKSRENDKLAAQLAQVEEEKSKAEASLSTIDAANGNVIGQYETMIGILQAYRKDDFNTAVKLYAQLDGTLIVSEGVQAILAEVKSDMDQNGYQVLHDLGTKAAAAGNWEQAFDYYQKSLNIKSNNPQVILEMAQAYKVSGNLEEANRLFGELIMNHSKTEQAVKAKAERGY